MTALAFRVRAGTGTGLAGPALAALSLSAALGALAGLAVGARHYEPHDSINASAGAIASLFLHNAYVSLVPLALLALNWDEIPVIKNLGDVLAASALLVNGWVVGWAFARAGLDLLAYLPHLPFEWGAIALPVGAWFHCRVAAPAARRSFLLRVLVATLALLLVAAILEAWAVPIS